MVEINYCEICGEEGRVVPYTVVFEKRGRYGIDFGYAQLPVSLTVSYSQCLNCGLIWQNPRMSPDELHKYYSEGHYRASLGNSQTEIDADENERSIRITRQLHSLIPFHRFLDIGCSRGYLVKSVEDVFKCDAWGVESNLGYLTENIKAAENLSGVPNIEFDMVTMIHVLEHVQHPINDLIKIKNRLAEGGRLLIEVPSKNSKGGPLRLAHTYFYEPWVLVHMAEIAGFKVLDLTQDEHTQILLEANGKDN